MSQLVTEKWCMDEVNINTLRTTHSTKGAVKGVMTLVNGSAYLNGRKFSPRYSHQFLVAHGNRELSLLPSSYRHNLVSYMISFMRT